MSNNKVDNVKSGQGPNVVRTKAKPKVNPITGANFEYANEPRIGDSFVVVISSSSGTQSITLHHPIGVTDVDVEDWVATPTGDIPSLLARQVDPDEADRKAQRDKHRLDLAVAAGLLEKGSDGQLIYPDSGVSRQSALAAARTAARDAIKDGKGKPSPDLYVKFLDTSIQELESRVRQFLANPKTIREAEKAFPSTGFRTRSGPLADRDQVGLDYLSGSSRPQAIDLLVKKIYDHDDE
jgi:hypothetical protein